MASQRSSRLITAVALVSILMLAVLVRSYHLESIPGGLYPDEAVNAIDALQAIESGKYKLFYPNNYGREGLFINLQAWALKTFGPTIAALKLWSVVFGSLTVLGIYLLGTEIFKRRFVGIMAAFFTATSFWAINFSRIGFRAIMLSFLLSFTFYFFFRGLRTRKFMDFALSGFLLGLGLHTYIAARLTPLILILLLPLLMLSYEKFLKRFWRHGLAFGFAAFIAAAPMLYHFFIAHPEDFASRSASVSIFSPEVNQGHFFQTLTKTFGLSLVKYNFVGDQNWRHNYPPYPILDPVTGTLFLAGFLYVLWRFVVLFGRRIREGDRDTRLVGYGFLLATFFVMLMPEFLTEEGLPHALRAIGTQTPVFLFAAVPTLWILNKAKRSQSGMRLALISFLALALGLSLTFNLTKYFVFFAANPHQRNSFNEDYTNMSKYLLSLPEETRKYVYANAGGTDIDNGLPVTAQPIVFLTHDKIKNLEFVSPETVIQRPAVIILMRQNQAIEDRIRERASDASFETIDMTPGPGGEFTAIILSSPASNN